MHADRKKVLERGKPTAEMSLQKRLFKDEDTLPPLPSFTARKKRTVEFKSWNMFFDQNDVMEISSGRFQTYYTPPEEPSSTVFVLHHGAGSSALSFGLLAAQLKESGVGVFAFDARGHGLTRCAEKNYSLPAFAGDVVEILGNRKFASVVLVGHSLGGAILTRACAQVENVKGLCMLDIVEEAAVSALATVNKFLLETPQSFASREEAIEWHLKKHLVKNVASASVSIPALLYENHGRYEWRCNLRDFAPFWHDWFTGLSSDFVRAGCAKLLVLAGNENLDKELIIGQMQGKYQLVVFQESGHFIHEDATSKCCLTLLDFWRRNDIKIKTNWGSVHT